MAELSPAAKAVSDAVKGIAAATATTALLAVADQVAPADGSRRTREIRADILAIVTELEPMTGKITTYKLKTAFAELHHFDHFAKPDDFIEVSQWHNGEGFDAHLSRDNQTIRLTWGEFKALKKLIKELDK